MLNIINPFCYSNFSKSLFLHRSYIATSDCKKLNLKKILLLSKISRFEYERQLYPKCTEDRWFMRQRIRVSLLFNNEIDNSIILKDLHAAKKYMSEVKSNYPEQRSMEHISVADEPRLQINELPKSYESNHPRSINELSGSFKEVPLPSLALNEVFVGESLSARVSYYEISADDGPGQKQKSSGVTISTGTGSSSWSFHISSLAENSMVEILNILKERDLLPPDVHGKKLYGLADLISQQYNARLKYDPRTTKMAFTVRDPVRNGVFRAEQSKGFAERILIRSRMMDAHLVIDGSSAYHFNDGALARFEIHPENALRCVLFPTKV